MEGCIITLEGIPMVRTPAEQILHEWRGRILLRFTKQVDEQLSRLSPITRATKALRRETNIMIRDE